MEYDSGPMPPNELAQETVDAVRRALERYAREPAEAGPSLRAALHELAHEARLAAVPPEHLLIVLKRTWHDLPNVANASDQAEQTRNLQTVVTMCIKAYFGD
jgi:hypothetical protein